MSAIWRVGWVIIVVAAGLTITRGLVLATYFELTPQAQTDAESGRVWLWVATFVLLGAVAVAAWRWQTALWPLVAVAAAGPVALLVESWGWIPPVALFLVVPLLLVGCTGVVASPPRQHVF